MKTVLTIIIGILVFGFLIFIHELGHFIFAKLLDVKVNEFSIGMGPALFSKQKGETKYSVRLLPIGGYVAMEGENEDSEDTRAFNNKSLWKRAVILSAGAIFNVIFGFFVVLGITASEDVLATTVIHNFYDTSISNSVLMEDDKIIEINGIKTAIDKDIIFELMRSKSGTVSMTVERNGEKVELPEVEFAYEPDEDGTSYITIDFQVYGMENNILTTIKYAFSYTWTIIRTVWTSVYDIFRGRFGLNQMSGPVGVTSTIGEAASISLYSLFSVIAYIAINIGVFNLLPFPALDGGRLFFILIALITRKPVSAKVEGIIHTVGLMLLMILAVYVTFSDVFKLFKG